MIKVLLVFLVLLCGCTHKNSKNPEYIFVSYKTCDTGFFNNIRTCSDFHIGQAEVISKHGIMWHVRINGNNDSWINSTTADWYPDTGILESKS